MNITLSTFAWLSMAAYSVHILEEFSLDWRNWARGVLKLPVEWADFYVTNGIVVALGIAQAMLAPTLPIAPLAFAGLMLVNAIFFHVMPGLTTRRFSPGLMTVSSFSCHSAWPYSGLRWRTPSSLPRLPLLG